MARTLRTKNETGIYHVMMRGVKYSSNPMAAGLSKGHKKRIPAICVAGIRYFLKE